MKQAFAIITILAVLVFAFILIKNREKIFSDMPVNTKRPVIINTAVQSSNKNTTCELKDVNGNTVTITGSSDDPQFQDMCKLQPNSPVYVYGYPYTFISRGRRHGGGHRAQNGDI